VRSLDLEYLVVATTEKTFEELKESVMNLGSRVRVKEQPCIG